jgi:VanZ family protein
MNQPKLSSDSDAAPRHRSKLARVSFCAYLALVIDASLYPFVGWRDRGIGAFDYLFAPWPHHLLEFDMVVNVMGYLPLGLLAVYALYPRVTGVRAVLQVTVVAAALSACLEALQTYLPTRVASRMDLLTNAAGALLGALIAALTTTAVFERHRLREWRARWFEPHSEMGLVLVVLWFGAILYPDAMALASGSWSKLIESDFGELRAQIASWEPTALQFEFSEVAGSAAFLVAGSLLFINLLREGAPRLALCAAFIVLSLVAKTFGVGLTYDSSEPFVWITQGALFGVALGAAISLIALRWRRGARTALTVIALCVGVALSNLVPDNPYFGADWQDWERGKLLNFYGLALGVNLFWPLLALLYLIWRGMVRLFVRQSG